VRLGQARPEEPRRFEIHGPPLYASQNNDSYLETEAESQNSHSFTVKLQAHSRAPPSTLHPQRLYPSEAESQIHFNSRITFRSLP
jgi:outer membrane biosynthesis protein TonB